MVDENTHKKNQSCILYMMSKISWGMFHSGWTNINHLFSVLSLSFSFTIQSAHVRERKRENGVIKKSVIRHCL